MGQMNLQTQSGCLPHHIKSSSWVSSSAIPMFDPDPSTASLHGVRRSRPCIWSLCQCPHLVCGVNLQLDRYRVESAVFFLKYAHLSSQPPWKLSMWRNLWVILDPRHPHSLQPGVRTRQHTRNAHNLRVLQIGYPFLFVRCLFIGLGRARVKTKDNRPWCELGCGAAPEGKALFYSTEEILSRNRSYSAQRPLKWSGHQAKASRGVHLLESWCPKSESPGCLFTSSPKILLHLPLNHPRWTPSRRPCCTHHHPLQTTSNFSHECFLFRGHSHFSLTLFLCV